MNQVTLPVVITWKEEITRPVGAMGEEYKFTLTLKAEVPDDGSFVYRKKYVLHALKPDIMSLLSNHRSTLARKLRDLAMSQGKSLDGGVLNEQLYPVWEIVYNYAKVAVDGKVLHPSTDLEVHQIDGLKVNAVGPPLHYYAKTAEPSSAHFIPVKLMDQTNRLLHFNPREGYKVYVFPSQMQMQPNESSKKATEIFNASRSLPKLQWNRDNGSLMIRAWGEKGPGHDYLIEVFLSADPNEDEWRETHVYRLETIAALPRYRRA